MKYELCAYKTDKLSLESTIKAKIIVLSVLLLLFCGYMLKMRNFLSDYRKFQTVAFR